MKLFEYASPVTLEEALRFLGKASGELRALAGGTDLIAQIKENRRNPDVVVDVKRIPECNRLAYESDGLHIGSAVTCSRLSDAPIVRERFSILVEGASLIGSVQIQNRAGLAA